MPAALVTVSEGVGAAILAEGRIVAGQRGLASEFGHVCVDLRVPERGCGRRGCWEMFTSSRATVRYYRELLQGVDNKSILEIVNLAMDGQLEAIEALHRQAVAIGQGLHIINATFSPDLILLAGGITTFWEMSKDVIEREIKAELMLGHGPVLRSVGDGQAGRLSGATAIVLQRHSGYYRASIKRESAKAS
jgi:predicted NBD/HSP70 family sugar kinase